MDIISPVVQIKMGRKREEGCGREGVTSGAIRLIDLLLERRRLLKGAGSSARQD